VPQQGAEKKGRPVASARPAAAAAPRAVAAAEADDLDDDWKEF
jgi:hypothetical protein